MGIKHDRKAELSRQNLPAIASYEQCCILYGIYSQTFHQTVYARPNDIQPTPVDFKCDVEIKAKRVLSPMAYQMFLRLAAENPASEQYKLMPLEEQVTLGREFLKAKLEDNRHYGALFSMQRRNAQKAMIEEQTVKEMSDQDVEDLIDNQPDEGFTVIDSNNILGETQEQ